MPSLKSTKWQAVTRSLKIAFAVLTVGVLPNHLSCSRIVEESVTAGAGNFLTDATADLLNLIFRPDALDGSGGDNGNDNDDPFEPPIQT